jgi:adenosylmethionine-8-amino-7-oxononanoate aminotransferase
VTEEELAFDRHHLWHPYAGLPAAQPPLPVVAAEGCELILADGRRLIDGMSSWWAAIHGYSHPRLQQALNEQIGSLTHVMFGGITHPAAIGLGQRLVSLLPESLDAIFLADSGSVSIEVAMKMAIQYWSASGQTRTRFATVRGGYHGDTTGAMALCDPVTGMHTLFGDALTKHHFAPRPWPLGDEPDESDIEAMERLLEREREGIAAVVIEPLVQGAGGMNFYRHNYLKRLRRVCSELDILLIFDEIATGFGRTGHLFATSACQVTPDIITLGKALTGGTMTLAATVASRHVADTICSSEPGLFMHGPTFMANPLACAVASASIDLLLEGQWQQQVRRIEAIMQTELQQAGGLPGVADVRVLGAIGVVELDQPVDMAHIQPQLVELGVWIRPFGRLLYLMPPFIITEEQLVRLCRAAVALLARQ